MKVNERHYCSVPMEIRRGDVEQVHLGGSVNAFLSWPAPPLASAWARLSLKHAQPSAVCVYFQPHFTCTQSPLPAPTPGTLFSVLLSTKPADTCLEMPLTRM